MRPLRLGSSGKEVKAWQNFLIGRGFYKGASDGDFGSITHGATRKYQKASGLLDDGIVGNATIAYAMANHGFALVAPSKSGGSFPVRPDGIAPLGMSGSKKVFGSFSFVSAPVRGNAEAIRITDGWDERNIVQVVVPQLKTLGLSKTGKVSIHRKAAPQLLALWAAWEKAGILSDVISYEGAFVARFIRGSRTSLSNHSFGSAFDINAAWNGLGATPARLGEKGSVYRLIEIATKLGWYWGGYFTRLDAMHFELFKVLTEDQIAAVLAGIKS